MGRQTLFHKKLTSFYNFIHVNPQRRQTLYFLKIYINLPMDYFEIYKCCGTTKYISWCRDRSYIARGRKINERLEVTIDSAYTLLYPPRSRLARFISYLGLRRLRAVCERGYIFEAKARGTIVLAAAIYPHVARIQPRRDCFVLGPQGILAYSI